MKKQSTKKNQRLELNGGELVIEVDHRGAVYLVEVEEGEYIEKKDRCEDARYLELSASELDAIAAKSKQLIQLIEKAQSVLDGDGIRQCTRTCHHEIGFYDEGYLPDIEGDIMIGCQNISAEDIRRVHQASLKARGKKA